jgi:hypothetical protein
MAPELSAARGPRQTYRLGASPEASAGELEFLDILDEITFSKLVRDGFKGHSRTLAHAGLTCFSIAATLRPWDVARG